MTLLTCILFHSIARTGRDNISYLLIVPFIPHHQPLPLNFWLGGFALLMTVWLYFYIPGLFMISLIAATLTCLLKPGTTKTISLRNLSEGATEWNIDTIFCGSIFNSDVHWPKSQHFAPSEVRVHVVSEIQCLLISAAPWNNWIHSHHFGQNKAHNSRFVCMSWHRPTHLATIDYYPFRWSWYYWLAICKCCEGAITFVNIEHLWY